MKEVALTLNTAAGAHAANDILGGLLTFGGVGDWSRITGAQVNIKAAIAPALTLVLFDALPASTTQDDDAAYSLNAADAHKVIKAIPIATLFNHGTPKSYSVDSLNIPISANSGTIYGLLIDTTGCTPASTSDFQIRLRGE